MQYSVLEYLNGSVSKFAQRVALSDEKSEYTYARFYEVALREAATLHASHFSVNRPIAVYLPKRADAVVAFMAIVLSGNAYAPLDVKSPPERLRGILSNLKPVAIVTDPEGAKVLSALGVDSNSLHVFGASAEIDLSETARRLERHRESVLDTDPVYIIHTSGSTGVPKGVVISHRGVIDYIDWARGVFALNEADILGNQAPFHFDNSTLDIYLAQAVGAELHIIPEPLFVFPAQMLAHVVKRGVTFVFWVPSVLVVVANLGLLDNLAWASLRFMLFAGEVMPTRQLNQWRKALPGPVYANLYGPTEITVDCTWFLVNREFADDEPLPIGVACRNSGILILNEANQPCSRGEVGELCVRGSSLAMGYWNQPAKTAEAFVQNPLNPYYPELIYRTGDLVKTNERDEILYIGRKDFQIKHQGVRIELGEIEQAVLAHPSIKRACVVYPSELKEICLVYEAEVEVSPADLRKVLADRISKVMWPTKMMRLAELPLTPNGKVDRLALGKRFVP